jgi:hypothetical protein
MSSIVDTGFVGKVVKWEKSGRGVGEWAKGKVLGEVPAGTTNREAMDVIIKEHEQDYVFRSSYEKFADGTSRSERVIVAVERDNENRVRPVHDFYAPNRQDVFVVQDGDDN